MSAGFSVPRRSSEASQVDFARNPVQLLFFGDQPQGQSNKILVFSILSELHPTKMQNTSGSLKTQVPEIRVRPANQLPVRADKRWVLYWMTAFRRTQSNFALQYARDWAKQLNQPLLILEALRIRYPWASHRMHRFVIEGMVDNQAACKDLVTYYPYIEPRAGEGSGLLEKLAEQACVVVTDEYPCFFHPKMIRAVQHRLPARLELVDSNGLMPLRATDRTFTVAHSYRRFMQKALPQHLEHSPEANPLDGRALRGIPKLETIPQDIQQRWPAANLEQLLGSGLATMEINQQVGVCELRGGAKAARKLLNQFVSKRLLNYDVDRNEPDEVGSSELSPYLHFGHISAHEVFHKVTYEQVWHPGRLCKPNGKVNGYWGVEANSEAFLDQLCTWREIGFNMCAREENYDRFESLPDWAQSSLQKHEKDKRPFLYSLEQFENAATHDVIWNAAQRQLVSEGRIHNYLRMLWGKKILHWTKSAHQALEIMIELNNKYALDGRDPNSYSGIFWVLGRYDRAWGPERPVFGKIRYMTSENTAKKHALREYVARYS